MVSPIRTHIHTKSPHAHKARGSNISLGEFKCTTTNICISVEQVHLIYRSRSLKHLGKWGDGWKLRFPEAGCFGHVSSRHFRDVVLQCWWISKTRQREKGGRRKEGEMNKQQNNFFVWAWIFKKRLFFVKAKFEWREVGAGFLKRNDLFFGASKPASQTNKLSCFVKNLERREQVSQKRRGKEATS